MLMEVGKLIVPKLNERIRESIRLHPCHTNRASSLGEQCIRKLVYRRTRWQDAILHDEHLQRIFNEGNMEEREVLDELRGAGFIVIEQQRDFEWKEYQITAHIDGKILIDGTAYPIEIKSMSPFIFDSLRRSADMTKSKYAHIRAYVSQMQTYLLLSNSERGVFLIKNKSTGEIHEIWIDLDYELAEELIQKAQAINQHVAESTLPDRIPWDENHCGRCEFRHVCLPEAQRKELLFRDDAMIADKLSEHESLAEAKSRYEKLDKEIKALLKGEEKVVIGDYLITGKEVRKTIPAKEAYEQKYWSLKISVINDVEENEDE